MSDKPAIVVATLMPPTGTTGVQTHFNEILAAAEAYGHPTQLVHPYACHFLVRKPIGAMTRLLRLFGEEWVQLWVRWAHYRILKAKLRRNLRSLPSETVIYAQDPLSAKAALAARTGKHRRVAAVVHFNVSEADEHLAKGIIQSGSILHRQLISTEKAVLPRIDKLFYVSRFMQQVIEQRLPDVGTVPNAVLANFIDDQSAALPPAELHGDIISVGTLEPRKNQAFLIKVLAACNALGHRYRLTLIGDGPDKLMLKQLAHSLGVTDQVVFAGFRPNAALFMKNHRIYAHAATMENMPITLMEALSCSLPLLAVPVGGIPEIFSDGEEGFYWPLDDIAKAADRLCEILENDEFYRFLSANARTRYLEHFSKEALSLKWINELAACRAA